MTLLLTLCRDCAQVAPAAADCPTCGSARLVAHGERLELSIAHVDRDAFYASVEKRDDPSLRDKPLIVGHPGGCGVVTTACYIVRRFGPRSAIPMWKALEFAPMRWSFRPTWRNTRRPAMPSVP